MQNKNLGKISISIVLAAILGTTNVYGVCSSDVDMGSNKITSSAVPINQNDLTNKLYVDGAMTTAFSLYSAASDPAELVAAAAGYGVVTDASGRVWLDRNLGASRVATSATDSLAYGDLYQWGRAADGHEKRDSATTTTQANIPADLFIIGSNDWRVDANNTLWTGVDAVNNPCPFGFRIPTEAEFNVLLSAESITNLATGFASSLKLTAGGVRNDSDGRFNGVGTRGLYWASSVFGTESRDLNFYSGGADLSDHYRAFGFSVRCVKD